MVKKKKKVKKSKPKAKKKVVKSEEKTEKTTGAKEEAAEKKPSVKAGFKNVQNSIASKLAKAKGK